MPQCPIAGDATGCSCNVVVVVVQVYSSSRHSVVVGGGGCEKDI